VRALFGGEPARTELVTFAPTSRRSAMIACIRRKSSGKTRRLAMPTDGGTKTCQVDVLIEEHEERPGARARLSGAGRRLVGIGLARLDPADEPVAQIGDELAVARALSD